MGLKSKVFAAAATLTLVGGVSTVGMLSASAATPSCGGACVDIFSREFGTHRTPNFVLDVWRQGAKVGQPIILFRTSDTDPAEDINASFQGLTSDFFAAGLVSSAVELHYGGGLGTADWRERLPGRPGVRARVHAVRRGQRPVRRRCQHRRPGHQGQPAAVWRFVEDRLDRGHRRLAPSASGYVPLINGSDTNFSHPFVLTYPTNGLPDRQAAAAADHPEPDRVHGQLPRSGARHRQRQPAVGR